MVLGVVALEFRLRVEVIDEVGLGGWLAVSTFRSVITPLTILPLALTP